MILLIYIYIYIYWFCQYFSVKRQKQNIYFFKLFIWNKSNNCPQKKANVLKFLTLFKAELTFYSRNTNCNKYGILEAHRDCGNPQTIITMLIIFKEAQTVSLRETKYESWKTDGKKEEKQCDEFVNGVRHAVSRHPHVPFETSCRFHHISSFLLGGNACNANMGACSPATNQKLGARVTQPIRARQPHPRSPDNHSTSERERERRAGFLWKHKIPLQLWSEFTYTRKTTYNLCIYDSHALDKHSIWYLTSWAVKHSH